MTTGANRKEVPYFIQVSGCNNCQVYKSYTTSTGTEYGGDHELHAKCVHMGCDGHGHNIVAPFITPREYLRIGLNTGLRSQAIDRAKQVIKQFSEFYDARGGLQPWVVRSISREDAKSKPSSTSSA